MKFPKYIDMNNGVEEHSCCLIKVKETETGAYYWRPGGMWGIGVDEDLVTVKKDMPHMDGKQCYPCSIIRFIICNGRYAMEEQYYDFCHNENTYESFMEDIKAIENLFKDK